MKIIFVKFIFFFITLSFLQEEIPNKPSDEFQVNIDLKFKEKPSGYSSNTFSNTGESLNKPKSGNFAFLSVNISQLKIREDEKRIIVVDSDGKELLRKKTPLEELHFAMGFVEELKNGTTSNEITVYFLSAEKKKLEKIILTVLPSGVFQINSQWHGQF